MKSSTWNSKCFLETFFRISTPNTVKPSYQLSKLQRVMNTSARLVYCAPKSCHITPLLRELHWLSICYRVEYKILLLTFKVLHGMAPDYLHRLVDVLPPSRYNLRRNHDPGVLLISPIRTKKTLGDRSFSCADPRLWNLVPSTIRSVSSLSIFKSRLQTFLFTKAFD